MRQAHARGALLQERRDNPRRMSDLLDKANHEDAPQVSEGLTMTNEELNRAVALARQKTEHPGFYYQEFATEDGDGWSGFCCPRCYAEQGDTGICAPNVCHSPAAWGALLEWLKTQWYSPGITHDHHVWWSAYVVWSDKDEVKRADAMELSPGRALAVAFLRARGHEIADPEY